MPLDVPDLVHQRALANGQAGHIWLHELPDRLERLAEKWNLTIGEPFQGGTAAYVVEATEADGAARVLKIAMPLDDVEIAAFDHSVAAHQIAAGQGCVTMIAHHRDSHAMLLERIGPNLDEIGLTVQQILEVVATTLNTFWKPVKSDTHGLPTGADKAGWLASFIDRTWEELGRPCSREAIEQALAYCDERAAEFDPATSVLVHGDAHGWNTLLAEELPLNGKNAKPATPLKSDSTSGGESGYKFVDPEGLLSDRAHDLAVPMREYNEPLAAGNTRRLVRDRAEMLAEWCDVDPEAVWQWGFIERVSTGLANVRDFEGTEGRLFLDVAERCLR